MKALLITPSAKTVAEIQVDPHDYKSIARLLGTDDTSGFTAGHDAYMYCDDWGRSREGQHWFRFLDEKAKVGYRGTLAGTMVMVGLRPPEGDACDVPYSAEWVMERITWLGTDPDD